MQINRGEINELVVTVAEKTTLSGTVYYLWEFYSKDNKYYKYCIATIGTDYGARQSFSITETSSPDPLSAEVFLPKGDYLYKIYQQISSTNLDPKLTLPSTYELYVDIGLVTSLGGVTEPTSYSGATTTNTNYEQE